MSAAKSSFARLYKSFITLVYQVSGVKIVYKVNTKEKVIYITFDDGPNKEHTLPILKVLEKYNAKATFFVVGEYVSKHPDIVEKVVEGGHLIASHTYSHRKSWVNGSPGELKSEILKCENELEKYAPDRDKMFRAPWGKLNMPVVQTVKNMGLKIVHWSYDSEDYRKKGWQEIVDRFEAKPVKSGDIILFHDDNADTCSALNILLDRWTSEGYRFGICY